MVVYLSSHSVDKCVMGTGVLHVDNFRAMLLTHTGFHKVPRQPVCAEGFALQNYAVPLSITADRGATSP